MRCPGRGPTAAACGTEGLAPLGSEATPGSRSRDRALGPAARAGMFELAAAGARWALEDQPCPGSRQRSPRSPPAVWLGPSERSQP